MSDTAKEILKVFDSNAETIKRIFTVMFPEGWVEVSVLLRGDYSEEKREFDVRGRYSRYFNMSRREARAGFIKQVRSILEREVRKETLRGLYFGMQPRKENLFNKPSSGDNVLGIYNIVLDIDVYHGAEDNAKLEEFGLTSPMKLKLLDIASTAVSAFKRAGIEPVYAVITGRGVQIAFRLEKPVKGDVQTRGTEVVRAIAEKLEGILRVDKEFSRKFKDVEVDYNAAKLAQIVRFPATANGAVKRFILAEFAYVAEDLENAVLSEEFVKEALEAANRVQTAAKTFNSTGVEVLQKAAPTQLSDFTVELSDERKNMIAQVFAEIYRKGTHNDLALALAGFLAWRRVRVKDALETVNLFLNMTNDAENSSIIEKELDGVVLRGGRRAVEKVYYTYKKALEGARVAWKALLRTHLRAKAVKEADSNQDVDELVDSMLSSIIMRLNRAFPRRRVQGRVNEDLLKEFDAIDEDEKAIFNKFTEFINLFTETIFEKDEQVKKKKAMELSKFEFNLFEKVQENLVRAVIYIKPSVEGASRKYVFEVLDKKLNVHEVRIKSLKNAWMDVLTGVGAVREEYLIPPASFISDALAQALGFDNAESALILSGKSFTDALRLLNSTIDLKLKREYEKFLLALRSNWEVVRVVTDEEIAEDLLYAILTDSRILLVESDEVYYQGWIYLTSKNELLIPASIVEERLSLNKISGKAFVSVLRKRKLLFSNEIRKYRTTRRVKLLEELAKDFAGDLNYDASVATQETFYRLNAPAVFEFISQTYNEDVRKRIVSLDEALDSIKLFELKEKFAEAIEAQEVQGEDEELEVLEIQVAGGEAQ